jgi:hypothetical protein
VRFRKIPVEVEAQIVTPHTIEAVANWCRGRVRGVALPIGDWVIQIDTRDGEMAASMGDWVIEEPFPTADRRFYPCKPDIFAATYEPAEEDQLRAWKRS